MGEAPRGIERFLRKLLRSAGKRLIELSNLPDSFVQESRLVEPGERRSLYRTQFGDLFWLDKSAYVDSCIIKDGVFERNSTEAVRRIVKTGDVAIDVGANIGYYSVMLSRIVGEQGRVYAFEPTDFYCDVLMRNLDENRIRNVDVFRVGLSDREGEQEIHIGGSSATIHPIFNQPIEKEEMIRLVPLDDFVDRLNPGRIDFIKVDVNGHEPLFLDGARRTLEAYDPILLIEVSHLHYLEAVVTAWDFYDSLKQRGDRIFHEDRLEEIRNKTEFLIRCGNSAP